MECRGRGHLLVCGGHQLGRNEGRQGEQYGVPSMLFVMPCSWRAVSLDPLLHLRWPVRNPLHPPDLSISFNVNFTFEFVLSL